MQGTLTKMRTGLDAQGTANYFLMLGDTEVALNPLIGKPLQLIYSGNIYCCNCGRKTKKSYSEGHCFVCMQKLASCDMCILKPETCHFDKGTCREPQWGLSHCFVPHFVYLSNTSGLKVGITRHTQIPTRWIDQGATQGLPILKVASRKISGLIEVEIAKHVADKTHWQAMLKGNNANMDLAAEAARLLSEVAPVLADIRAEYGEDAVQELVSQPQPIDFPVTKFPTKVTSFNLDKAPIIEGVLTGIKGQYLIFDTGVINIRKYTGYEVSIEY
ncbi:DUF2797 domain-containing protein [Shewanella cyperi]|uniref:DUF2797 domain-containing protein n=1 Tax=Shewanella cyperi TaxID=2814292 RepID=A0A974XMN9_9GAMM|nr:DUF2797 domain-containing protein [Shewanella cyperi]QSX31154.1 DUF2797 domain-containing protein [Shewanella cyperi]QSX41934.1 DUF2797 domain-containing protein [Shewanella cyperi]